MNIFAAIILRRLAFQLQRAHIKINCTWRLKREMLVCVFLFLRITNVYYFFLHQKKLLLGKRRIALNCNIANNANCGVWTKAALANKVYRPRMHYASNKLTNYSNWRSPARWLHFDPRISFCFRLCWCVCWCVIRVSVSVSEMYKFDCKKDDLWNAYERAVARYVQ